MTLPDPPTQRHPNASIHNPPKCMEHGRVLIRVTDLAFYGCNGFNPPADRWVCGDCWVDAIRIIDEERKRAREQ